MLTIRAVATLLACADSLSALHPLARLLGFGDEPCALTASARRALGLGDTVAKAALFDGPASLRLLTAVLLPPQTPGADARERTRHVAAALVRHAPTRHWCLCTLDHDGHTLCIATVSDEPGGPRIAALRVDRRRVLDSDADTVRALAAVTEHDDVLRHARFSDILRRDALSHRFYRALEQAVDTLAHSLAPVAGHRRSAGPLATPTERRELALLCTSRCLFLAFLEAKGWLDERRDFLLHHTLQALEHGGRLHDRLLRPLFFGTLNTPRRQRAAAALAFGRVPFLNGGLFSPTPLERRYGALRFGDDPLVALVTGLLDRYRFTSHEESTSWSEAAIDPEMLGRAFEGLMGHDERRRSGSFYTPPTLVAHTVHEALAAALPGIHEGRASLPQLDALRVLDPACGSGAFLVHVLETLDRLRGQAGDPRSPHERRRQVLARSIFGVDRQPLAVWLCELRLWLSVAIASHETDVDRIAPLPNLDHHIRVGDSLAGGTFRFAPPSARVLTRLRDGYTHAAGPRKQAAARALEREERARTIAELTRRIDAIRRERRQLLTVLRGHDLFGQRRRPARSDRARLMALRVMNRDLLAERNRLHAGGALPFRFAAMFADVAAAGGFSLVVGNPPWVRPHAMPHTQRLALRQEFASMRHAAWRLGAARAGAGAGFAAQADLAVAFVERSLQLLAPGGTLGVLVPAKLWRTLSGGGIRRLLLHDAELHTLHDWSDAPALFEAATYPSLIVARRRDGANTAIPAGQTACIAITRRHTVAWALHAAALPIASDPGAPWILHPPDARAAFNALHRAGPALAASSVGRPLLGVKCGCNAAVLVQAVEHHDDSATVTSLDPTPRQGVIERTLLRPALRGEAIVRPGRHRATTDTLAPPDTRIVWTHGPDGAPLRTLPPATTRWLAQWRPRLQARRDARSRQPWWTLHRTEAARFDGPRLVWADIGKRLRVQLLHTGDPTVPLNSCYVVRPPTLDEAYALLALLTSTIVAAWLDPLAEPARGGFRRFLGWTVAALPIPGDWHAAIHRLAPLGTQLARGELVPDDTLDATVARAYGLPLSTLQPLLDWYHHA
ncbi:MAG: Eco57I restriction-modification methylase domain-containing protein [Gemmatimonas sp.]|uniref:Eco57I restriction-modification methylase domain-containing protein n=1 Tax=Gemmatimonas sp. TaxID=1962908 RepID=UPI00391F21EF